MSFQLALLYDWRTVRLEPALAEMYAKLDIEERRKASTSRVATILRRLGAARDPKSAEEAYSMLATEWVRAVLAFCRIVVYTHSRRRRKAPMKRTIQRSKL